MAVAVEYDRDIDTSTLTTSTFAVADHTVTKARRCTTGQSMGAMMPLGLNITYLDHSSPRTCAP
ncbi:hypothetical protein OHA73_39145 [Streptomyces sp. NBC_00483]